MSAGSSHTHKRSGTKPKGAQRAKSGCYTCRIRRKKCDEKPDAEGSCQTCVRLRLQCLGFGAKRPDWMREGNSVAEMREKIKSFLAQNGMIKGHSGTASLRPSGQSPTTPGASMSAGARATSAHSISLPTQDASGQEAMGLSTPLSATSTLTPEDGSASPPSPSTSHASSHSYANNHSFPPGYVDTTTGTHYDQSMSSSNSGMHHDQTQGSVLVLSTFPPHTRTQAPPPRHLRRPHHGDGFGGTNSGYGLGLMDDSSHPLSINGNGTVNSNSNMRCGPSSTSLHFPRSYSMTPRSATIPTHARPSPISYTSIPSRFSSGSLASPSSYSGASSSTYSHHHTPSTMNSISNATNMSSPTPGRASSTSSSPSMQSNNTPFTPYTPLPALPSPLPPTDNKSSANMDWATTTSTSATGSALLSPRSDTGFFGFGVDNMDIRWQSGHPNVRPGIEHGDGFNNGADTDPSNVRVKIEPDVAIDYTMGDSNVYGYNPYDTNVPLRPRSFSDDGCATSVANTFMNSTSGPANNNFTTGLSAVYDNNNTTNNYIYNNLPNSPSTNAHTIHGSFASTSMATREHGPYPPYATTGNSPSHNEPELSPDSPNPPHLRGNPMIAAYEPTSTPYMGAQGHGAATVYSSVAHHAPGQYASHQAHGRHGGAGQGGLNSIGLNGHGYSAGHGYGHPQPSSSWAGYDHTPLTNQDNLLHQQQPTQVQGPYAGNDSGTLQFPNASPTIRRTDLPPPNIQSSFGRSYYTNFLDELAMTNDMEEFAVQQTPTNALAIGGINEGALLPMSFYTQAPAPAPISETGFFSLSHEQQQQAYQELALSRPLQSALTDPVYIDRGDGSLVEHYMRHVRPVQYFFLNERVVDLLRAFAFNNDAVRNAICSVASVHKRRMREGSIPLRGGSPTTSPSHAPLAITAGAPEGDDDNAYYKRIEMMLKRTVPSTLTEAEAMAGLQCISSFLFAGGVGNWDFFLDIACQWVGIVLSNIRNGPGDAFLLDHLTQMKRDDELSSFVVRTTMWFEVLASVTMVRAPRFLDVYRKLFSTGDGARIVEIDGEAARSELEFSMLEVMGCDNLTFLALAEISALAAWKEKEEKNQTLSSVELVQRGFEIQQLLNGANRHRDGSASNSDSLENRRRLTADIFRASARLYLHTVLSGDKPSVKEIRAGIRETIEALRRVPSEPIALRRSVVRSVVFPICLAGCMTDDEKERNTVKQFLEGEGGAGNCGSVVAVMETVWERRDAKHKRGRRAAEHVPSEVSWREVLKERGGGMPILLV